SNGVRGSAARPQKPIVRYGPFQREARGGRVPLPPHSGPMAGRRPRGRRPRGRRLRARGPRVNGARHMFRARLASLWLSQTARVMADNCLRLFVVLELLRGGVGGGWYLVTAILMLPAVVLAPLNGALCNSLPKRWVLIGSAAFALAVMIV